MNGRSTGLSTASRSGFGRLALNGAAGLSLAFILIPLFFVTWYGTAILATGLVSAVVGRRLLRW